MKHLPGKKIWVFGSRITDRAKPYSDLDLAIIDDSTLPLSLIASLTEDFINSDLPFKVDLVDWVAISPEFQSIILNHHVEWL